ncbi:hypothetical protein LCGC14_2306650, partial [marine sediment metagenome]
KERDPEVQYLDDLIAEGLQIDGAHHKQWYLEQVLLRMGYEESDLVELGHERGIAP